MKITVCTSAGRQLPLTVEPGACIADLKELVHDREDIPSEEQRLVFAGKILEDEEALEAYNIQAGCTIHLVVRPAWDGVGPITFFVKMLTGRAIAVSMDRGGTIADLKARLQEMEGITPLKQRIIHARVPLDDERTLANCHIKHDDTVHLLLQGSGDGSQ